jgi:opacity protein-like surface antigen
VKFSGTIWEDADPDFANYNYNYDVVYTHIAVKAKLFAKWTETTHPYVGASAGVGFNRAHNFFISPRIPEAVPAPPFTAKTTDGAFAYTLEAGLQHVIDTHWRGGVGYEFADWGASSLGRAPGQTLNSGLALSHLYTNGVQFNLTYVV